MSKTQHLCVKCKYSTVDETEGKDCIFVSYGCKFGDKERDTKLHAIIVTTPMTDHVTECPKFEQLNYLERLKRKFLWWL